jgi:signal transduction histidine kinase
MATLIDDILELARINRIEIRAEHVDISSLGEQVVQRLLDGNPGQKVEVSIQPDMRMSGDPKLLTLVMENLIGNAFKYTSATPDARVDIGTTCIKGEEVYYVRDNGAGFDMEYYAKLFEPFQRLHGDEEFPGTGIGLATVQRIVERHGGRVWAEGEPGKGATFYLALPH